jgi:hypothetical protein
MRFLRSTLFGVFIACAAFLSGLFALPQRVETIRWIKIESSPDIIWDEIQTTEAWDHWDPWGHGASNGDTRIWRMEETLRFQGQDGEPAVDPDRLLVQFVVEETEGTGQIAIEPTPDFMWVRWSYGYPCGWNPFQRLLHWTDRGSLALEMDKGLANLKKRIEKKSDSNGTTNLQ